MAKSKPCGFGEMKSVFLPDEVGFRPEGISPHEVGFQPSQADFAEKVHCFRIGLFLVPVTGIEPVRYPIPFLSGLRFIRNFRFYDISGCGKRFDFEMHGFSDEHTDTVNRINTACILLGIS